MEEKKSKAFQCMFPILQTFLNSAKEIVLETRNNLVLVIVVHSGLQGWPHYITGGQLKPECFWKIDIFLSSLPGGILGTIKKAYKETHWYNYLSSTKRLLN